MSRILPKHAAQLIFTAQRVDAETARAWGLVNEVVSPAGLLPRAVAIAEHVAAFDKVTLAYGKRTYRTLDEMGWSDGVAYSATASAFIRTTREVVRRREESTE
jgi:enoyl-CoA hydratase/carnithine racemase